MIYPFTSRICPLPYFTSEPPSPLYTLSPLPPFAKHDVAARKRQPLLRIHNSHKPLKQLYLSSGRELLIREADHNLLGWVWVWGMGGLVQKLDKNRKNKTRLLVCRF